MSFVRDFSGGAEWRFFIKTEKPKNMNISKIELETFKKVSIVEIEVSDINVLIGGNNAGKSSVLQGIHFSVVAGVAARRLGTKTFTQDNLLYCPTRNFITLRHGAVYKNQSNFSYLRIKSTIDEKEERYTIKVYCGRNEGNVGCDRTGNQVIGTRVTDTLSPFSIYVPGLAGIPQVEEYRSESVVRRGVASGDANLYLRNVIYLIKEKNLMPELLKLMQKLFPNFSIEIKFDPTHDTYIDIFIGLQPFETKKYLELVGTGVLQSLQIFSYVTLFKPALLLLDEPDSHLHPDNQTLLADSLKTITENAKSKVIISTHSRHLVDALHGEANFIWLKEGKVVEQGLDLPRIPILMDIGALDSFEKIREGKVKYVLLTEDSNKKFITILLESCNYLPSEIIVYSYKTSTNIHSAGALTEFIKEIAPNTKVIIHADNDFLINEEIKKLEDKILSFGAEPFITEGSDIEAYFINPKHIAYLLSKPEIEVIAWINEIAKEKHNELTHRFSRKRDDAKSKLYKKGENPPETLKLLGETIPLEPKNRVGKIMIGAIRNNIHTKFGITPELAQKTPYLKSDKLISIKNL